jgi:putative flippase GtrA
VRVAGLARWMMVLFGQSWRFLIVGTIGFVVDAGLLVIGMAFLGLGHYSGRAVSFMAAVCVTWWLNRTFTFRALGAPGSGRKASILKELATYVLFQSVGIAINFGVYSALIQRSATFYDQPALAVAAGSLVAMVFNFATARWIVFRPGAREPNRPARDWPDLQAKALNSRPKAKAPPSEKPT